MASLRPRTGSHILLTFHVHLRLRAPTSSSVGCAHTLGVVLINDFRLDVYWLLLSPTLTLALFVACVLRAAVLADMWFNGWLVLEEARSFRFQSTRLESL